MIRFLWKESGERAGEAGPPWAEGEKCSLVGSIPLLPVSRPYALTGLGLRGGLRPRGACQEKYPRRGGIEKFRGFSFNGRGEGGKDGWMAYSVEE